ncbi:uncharacterized protein spd-2 [Drosophila tropicalis]|uniref:uncharacterized protein spd-2 n=1 Tax=Drosophila tropicalis TaxID=46794 RepID=UPI0035ABD648
MDKSNAVDQNSLGILSMENLKVFGDMSNNSRSRRDSSNVHERLKAERQKALEMLDKPRLRSSRPSPSPSISTNISELITDETINLNTSGSFALETPRAAISGRNISFEPAEITGRSTLCQHEKQQRKKAISVSDILKSSFVEKARLLEKKLPSNSNSHPNSTLMDSFNYSRSLPRTADLSNLSLNGGAGFSFGSSAAAVATENNCDESFAPAELMQSKLVLGEISWAQAYTAMPTATLSKQALEKIKAPVNTSDIDISRTNSVLAGDPDFSLGTYFQTRSENIWNIVGQGGSPANQGEPQALVDLDLKTPQPDNKTYTKTETESKPERNLWKRKQQEKIEKQKASELLSLSAIDKALRSLDLNSDTSTVEVVNRLKGDVFHGRRNDEDKENDQTLCDQTQSFTDSLLNSSDFKHLQKSITRNPLSPLAEQPQIKVTGVQNQEDNLSSHEADIDEWPSTPIKSPGRRVRRTKLSPRNVSPCSSEGVRPLTTTTEEDDEDEDERTPVNKPIAANKRLSLPQPSSLSSTRLDGCEAVASSTECDFGVSPNLPNKASPMSSPRSCISSPLLDSTTSSDRRMLTMATASAHGAAAPRKTQSSPAGSERSTGLSSRCSNSSEFSHRDGKRLPLKVTHTSLCWGSTKLRTDVRKSLQIKNTADKRLAVRLGIQGPGFQLVGNESSTITLQALECRSIMINFCPTVCGAAMGALLFYAPLGGAQPGMEIPLYGYGGNASISIQGLLKGPVGASFLTIGDVCELSSGGPLKATCKFHNKGPLTAFVSISVDSTVLMKLRLSEAFEVRPSQMILPPHSERIVEIQFRPNRDDMKNILKKSSTQQVLTLANMRIFCGDEPNRQRMRNLIQRMTKRQREHLTSSMLDSVWSNFPEEQIIRNLSQLNEPAEFILDLVTVVRIIDVALTLNRDFDESAESSLLFLPEAEETVLFRTICQAANSPTPTQSHMLEPVDELEQEADTTTTMLPNWSVDPYVIEFDQASVGQIAKLTIKNNFRSRQLIEINCNRTDIIELSPRECYVSPDGGQIDIQVKLLHSPPCRRGGSTSTDIVISVAMENERIQVPVIIKV